MHKNIYLRLILTIAALFTLLNLKGEEFSEKDSFLIDSLQLVYVENSDRCLKGQILMESVEVLYRYDKDTVASMCSLAIEVIADSKDSLCLSVLGTAYNNLGVINDDEGHILKAIKAYEASILIFEQIDNLPGIATSYTNIGYIYKNLHELEKCLKFNKKALNYRMQIGDKLKISNSLNNIGYVFRQQRKLDSALYYYQKSLRLRQSIDYRRGVAISMNNIGAIHKDLNQLDSALYFYQKGLSLYRKSKITLSNSFTNIGEIYFKLKDYKRAKLYADSAMEVALQTEMPERIKVASKLSYLVCGALKQWEKAYYFQNLHYEMLDSIESQGVHDKLILEEAKFKYIRDHIQDSLDFVQKQKLSEQLHQAEMESEKRISFYELIGIIFLLVIVFGLALAYRLKRSSEKDLDEKNQELENKSSQITTSINYAKKIQRAVLEYDKQSFSDKFDHFIIYEPKEIVSGDFYRIYDFNDTTFVAVADCSGHGVPAGFLSMLGISFLNEIITTHYDKSPAEILNLLSLKFVMVLNQTGEMINKFDGMDIVLVKLEKGKSQLEWAGANRPLIIAQDNEISVKKPNIGSIGFFQGDNRFENRAIDIKKGTKIYLTSDGFTDQFGSNDNKKIGYNNLSSWLKEVENDNMQNQKTHLRENYQKWKGEEDQLDDVCIVGLSL